MRRFANISLALLRHGNIVYRRKLFFRWGFVLVFFWVFLLFGWWVSLSLGILSEVLSGRDFVGHFVQGGGVAGGFIRRGFCRFFVGGVFVGEGLSGFFCRLSFCRRVLSGGFCQRVLSGSF